MSAKHKDLASAVRKAVFVVGCLGINLIPSMAYAGAVTGGATLPEQIVQEVTALQNYAKNITTALSSVQNEINTLNSYMTELQNLATLPSREISKITTPIQQMEYNYNEIMGLKNEYQQLYGNLSNIQSTVEQQNLDILNSALSPENYLNTVETAQTNTAAQTRAQIQEAANSMQAVDKLAPEIESQSNEASAIDGNTSGQVEMAKELNTIEQQNQILLQDISSAQMAANQRRATHEAETEAVDSTTALAALSASNQEAVSDTKSAEEASSNAWNDGGSEESSFLSCINHGSSYITCACKETGSTTGSCANP